ncbi:MAG: Hsp70 family protein, partial [Candidatus Cloacimonadia bacterium]
LGTGKKQQIRIDKAGALDEEEIKRMVREAEEHAEEDKKLKERIQVRNEFDTLIFTTEKSLQDYGDKLNPKDREEIENAIKEAKSKLESEDIEELKNARKVFEKKAQKLGEIVYQETVKQQQAQQGQTAGGAGDQAQTGEADTEQKAKGKSEDETVEDADFEVVDDDDNKN